MRAVACLVAAACFSIGAIDVGRAAALAPMLDEATVLAHYREALVRVRRPRAVSFEYSLSQLGLRDMEQVHRVYRRDRNERDETLFVDGYRLVRPSIRIITGRTAHYDIATIAPRPGAYRFAFAGGRAVGAGYQYVFRTKPIRPQPFAVREIELDGHTYLPAVVRFVTSSHGARGTGELHYGLSEAYWVVRGANVSATLRDGKRARERIVWQKYRFPTSLPAETFRVPPPKRLRVFAPKQGTALPPPPQPPSLK